MNIGTELLSYLDFDASMNATSGYIPTVGVLAQRALAGAEKSIKFLLTEDVCASVCIERAIECKGHTLHVMIGDLSGEAYSVKVREIATFLRANAPALMISRVVLRGDALYITLDAAVATIAREVAPRYLSVLAARVAA